MKKMMTTLFLISGTFLSEASEWKVINTESCGEEVIVKAKEGDPFVTVQKGTEEIKLLGKNGAVFHEESMSQTEFVSSLEKKTEYTFIYPSYVDGNPPKLDLVKEFKTKRCRLELTR